MSYNGFVNSLDSLLRSRELIFSNRAGEIVGKMGFELRRLVKPSFPVFSNSERKQVDQAMTPSYARLHGGYYSASVIITATYTPVTTVDDRMTQKKTDLTLAKLPVMIGSVLCHTIDDRGNRLSPEQLRNIGEDPNEPGSYFIVGAEKVFRNYPRLKYNESVVIPSNKDRGNAMVYMIVSTNLGTSRVMVTRNKNRVYDLSLTLFGKYGFNVLYPFAIMGVINRVDIMNFINPFIPPVFQNQVRVELNETFLYYDLNPDWFNMMSSIDLSKNSDTSTRFFSKSRSKKQKIEPLKTRELMADMIIDGVFANYRDDIRRLELKSFEILEKFDRSDNESLKGILTLNEFLTKLDANDLTINTPDEQKDVDLLQQINENIKIFLDYKLYMLGSMIAKLVLVNLRKRQMDNRDSWGNKTLVTAGIRFKELFIQTWKSLISTIQNDRITYKTQPDEIFRYLSDNSTITDEFQNQMKGKPVISGVKGKETTNVFAAPPDRVSLDYFITSLLHISTPSTGKGSQVDNRLIRADMLGYVCYVHTPEGQNCGLLNVMSALSQVSQEVDDLDLINRLDSAGLLSLYREQEFTDPLFVNGRLMSWCNSNSTYSSLLGWRRSGTIAYDISLSLLNGSLRVYTDAGRLIRPLLLMDESSIPIIDQKQGRNLEVESMINQGMVEYLSSMEAEPVVNSSLSVAAKSVYIGYSTQMIENYRNDLRLILNNRAQLEMKLTEDIDETSKNSIRDQLFVVNDSLAEIKLKGGFTHVEIDPAQVFGRTTMSIPAIERNAAPRGTYQCKISDQAISSYSLYYLSRFDTTGKVLAFPKPAIFTTQAELLHEMEINPTGDNLIVLLGIYGGQNQEDGQIISKSAIDTGKLLSIVITSHTNIIDRSFFETFGLSGLTDTEKSDAKFHAIDRATGIPRIGAIINPGDALIGKVRKVDDNGRIKYVNFSTYADSNTQGRILRVFGPTVDLAGNNTIKVMLLTLRKPGPGQKMAYRPAQKGVVSEYMETSDLPFNPQTGLYPDLIVNPHAIGKRMTMSPILEMILGTAGAYSGERINATAFRKFDTTLFTKIMTSYGFDESLTMEMTSGIDGSRMVSTMQMGVVHVLSLRHQIEDKMKAKAQRGDITHGPQVYDPFTGRPSGRGAIRFGEMEENAIRGHGAQQMLVETLVQRSNGMSAVMCVQCGGTPHVTNDGKKIEYKCDSCNNSNFGVCTIPQTALSLGRILSTAGLRLNIKSEKVMSSLGIAEPTTGGNTRNMMDFKILPTTKNESMKPNLTSRYMTNYELSRLVATRATELNNGAVLQIDPGTETDSIHLARLEIEQHKIPYIIRRNFP